MSFLRFDLLLFSRLCLLCPLVVFLPVLARIICIALTHDGIL